jgi:hypothetical protein
LDYDLLVDRFFLDPLGSPTANLGLPAGGVNELDTNLTRIGPEIPENST